MPEHMQQCNRRGRGLPRRFFFGCYLPSYFLEGVGGGNNTPQARTTTFETPRCLSFIVNYQLSIIHYPRIYPKNPALIPAFIICKL